MVKVKKYLMGKLSNLEKKIRKKTINLKTIKIFGPF